MKITATLVLDKLREMYGLSFRQRSSIGIDSLAMAMNAEIAAIRDILAELEAGGHVVIEAAVLSHRSRGLSSSGKVSLV